MFVICIDFDGTCVEHKYPKIGKDIGAIPWLLKFQEAGAKLILYTMRDKEHLEEAVKWFKDNKIELYGVNRNPTQFWTTSNKCYGNLYIDDAAFGCPLKDGYVDWKKIGPEVLSIIRSDK
jgi:hypothetical protein